MTYPQESELKAKFQSNVDGLVEDLVSVFGLKFNQQVDNLNSPLLRWIDFRLRFVDPQPRNIVFSDQFPKCRLPEDAVLGLDTLCRLVSDGGDINPYQGRGLIMRHDTSGDRREDRTDLLWADWGIHHFHLSAKPIPDSQYFSLPADYLCFCIVGGDTVALIDVLPHPSKSGFSNPDLMEVIHRNWPTYLDRFVLKGIVGLSKEGDWSQEQFHSLRINGVCAPFSIGDKAYLGPGMGITTASTSLKGTIASDRVRDLVDQLAALVSNPEGQFQVFARQNDISNPDFSLLMTLDGLGVYEKNTGHGFLLSRSQDTSSPGHFEELLDLLAPAWAATRLLSSHSLT
jgi:hypothetical protein